MGRTSTAAMTPGLVVDGQDGMRVLIMRVQPDGSWLDVASAVRKRLSTAHVIVLGAASAELDRVEVLRQGADDDVVKPFFVGELDTMVGGAT